MSGPSVVAVGGGHGLACTLRACVPWAGRLTAIVSVADDGGSSGRIRAATGLPAMGDLRRCLTSLASKDRSVIASSFEHRFGAGELAGHAAGNVLLAALVAEAGDLVTAVDEAARLLGVPEHVTVLPASSTAAELVARTTSGEIVHGQVSTEATRRIRTVTVEPADATPPPQALSRIERADLIVLGPGSLYGSVIAAIAVPDLARSIASSRARRVFVCNLRSRAPETEGYDVADHVDALRRHGVSPDVVVADERGMTVGAVDGAVVLPARVAGGDGLAHDPVRLGDVLRRQAAAG